MNCPICQKEMASTNAALLCGECLKKLDDSLTTAPTAPQGTGWICPVCGRGNSPWSPSCPCGGHHGNPPWAPYPAPPGYPTHPGWPTEPYPHPCGVPVWDGRAP